MSQNCDPEFQFKLGLASKISIQDQEPKNERSDFTLITLLPTCLYLNRKLYKFMSQVRAWVCSLLLLISFSFVLFAPLSHSKVCQLIHRACLRACRRTEWGNEITTKRTNIDYRIRLGISWNSMVNIIFQSHSVKNSTIIVYYVLFPKAKTSLNARDCLSCTTDPCMFILFQDFARLRVVSLTSSLTSRRAEERVSAHYK